MPDREALIALIQELEWAGRTWHEPSCPSCGAFQNMDLPKTDKYPFVKAGIHRSDCKLAAALRSRDA